MAPIVCPICNTVAPEGAIFCDQCGYDLRKITPSTPPPIPASPPVASPSPPVKPDLPQGNKVICPSCGYAVTPGALFCENCGARLPQSSPPQQTPSGIENQKKPQEAPYTQPLHPPKQEVSTTQTGRLVIKKLNINLQIPPHQEEVIIGREDPVSGIFPDINLEPYGGQEAGVGRRHARITRHGEQLYIEDLNSINGTFLNKHKLPPAQPFALHDGDEIRLGIMVLLFYAH